jgi:hypothetical protein
MDKIDKGALFSDCRRYRYTLWRVWDVKKPLVMVVGLNPSTANELADDPTIKRVTSIMHNWDAGGFFMVNLFALVTPYPEELFECEDPVKENDHYLQITGNICNRILFGWGNFKVAGRDEIVKKMFPDAYCLHINKNGSPKHPLYCRQNSMPFKYQGGIT